MAILVWGAWLNLDSTLIPTPFGPHTLPFQAIEMATHFSHPFLGTYEVIQFFELGNLSGTPFQSGMTLIPIPSYHGMDATYHSTSYHTIPFHTIPYHSIPFHTCEAFTLNFSHS